MHCSCLGHVAVDVDVKPINGFEQLVLAYPKTKVAEYTMSSVVYVVRRSHVYDW